MLNNTMPVCGFTECSHNWLGSLALYSTIIALLELGLLIIFIIIIFKLLKRNNTSGAQNVA
jgi:hypothetical protein